MSFSEWTKRLQLQAEKAKMAAKNFQGFDAMAAQDDYIHTDSLNVKRRQQHETSLLRPRDRDSKGQSIALHPKQGDATNSPIIPQHSLDKPALPSNNSRAPLLAVVQDVLNQQSHKSPSESNVDVEQQPLMGNSSDSEPDDDHDPILQHITRQRMASNKSNRFMDDLDARVSKENAPLSLPVLNGPKDNNLGVEKKVEHPRAWISGWLGQRKQQHVKNQSTELAPLARRNNKDTQSNESNGDDDFNVVVSSAVLQVEELAELRMLKSTAPGWTVSFVLVLREHPREAFIGLTFILCIFTYLQGRLITDDVH